MKQAGAMNGDEDDFSRRDHDFLGPCPVLDDVCRVL